ncbi:MAG: Rieske 2Fe-2S domain-containing protein [bacterium]|nr:Rieske 2Fe-2S domain-containing protein [bacterium]
MSDHPDPGPTRRWINALLGLGIVTTISGFASSALAYLWPAARSAGSEFLVGSKGPVRADDIGPDGSVVGRSRLGKILVVRRQDALIGLQATCTHLGCTVAWNAASGEIECPCHGARYNLHGEVLGGPAREGLAPVLLTIEEGGIRVRPARES